MFRVVTKGFQAAKNTLTRIANNLVSYFFSASIDAVNTAITPAAVENLNAQKVSFTGELANSIELVNQDDNGSAGVATFEVTAPYAALLEFGFAPGEITTEDINFESLLIWVKKKKEPGATDARQLKSARNIVHSFVTAGRDAHPFFEDMTQNIFSSKALPEEIEKSVSTSINTEVSNFVPYPDS